MALFDKIRQLMGLKPKGYVKNEKFNEEKLSAIKEYEQNTTPEKYEEQSENITNTTRYYISKKFSNKKLVICENMTSILNGKVLDGYPKYHILKKDNNQSYSYVVVSENQEVEHEGLTLEKSVSFEYENENGYNNDLIFVSDLKTNNYSNKKIVNECLREISTFSKQKSNNDLSK